MSLDPHAFVIATFWDSPISLSVSYKKKVRKFMSVRKRVQESRQNSTHNTRTISQNYSQQIRDAVEYNTTQVILWRGNRSWRKKSFSIEYDRNDICLTQSSFSFFSSSSYTRMILDRIERYERIRENVCDTYNPKPIPSTSCSPSKPPQSPLHRRLRSCCLFHTRKEKE